MTSTLARIATTLFMLTSFGCATTRTGSHLVGKPKVDRCANQTGKAQRTCREERDAATAWARRLAVDDQLCIDGIHRIEEPMAGCKVRAFVSSVAPNGVKLEIRASPEGSKYTVMSEWWFAEEAIADVQLKAFGYLLPGETPED
jgi:hypothetical protein